MNPKEEVPGGRGDGIARSEDPSIRATREKIFRRGSKTYFTSSLFFPAAVKEEVFTLYAFVRTADDHVDRIPQDREGFLAFRRRWDVAKTGASSGDPIVDDHARLGERRGFDPAWTEAFLDAMQADLSKTRYETLDETLVYMYGSAEVIGLYMARLLSLPEESLESACLLGRSMQYINFIRDLEEDRRLGRTYLPLAGTGFSSLAEEETRRRPEDYARFLRDQIAIYDGWRMQAEKGFRFIPWRIRVPIRTASEMYRWTGEVIRRDPWVVYRRQVKPRTPRILLELLKSCLSLPAR